MTGFSYNELDLITKDQSFSLNDDQINAGYFFLLWLSFKWKLATIYYLSETDAVGIG